MTVTDTALKPRNTGTAAQRTTNLCLNIKNKKSTGIITAALSQITKSKCTDLLLHVAVDLDNSSFKV